MSVRIRKRNGSWWVFISYHGRRKAKKVGTREAAERVKREIDARLALGDLGFFNEAERQTPTFGDYAARWQKEHVDVNCKPSSAVKHDQVLRLYLLPKFSQTPRRDPQKRLEGICGGLISGPKAGSFSV